MPIRTAIACSSCALHAGIDRLGLSALQLRFRLHHVLLRCNARRVTIAGELERPIESRGGIVEHLLLRVEDTQLKIVGSELGLRREARRREIGRARLRARRARLERAAQASPEIEFPR